MNMIAVYFWTTILLICIAIGIEFSIVAGILSFAGMTGLVVILLLIVEYLDCTK